MRESQFQAHLIELLGDLFPGCIVLKNDANYIQGFLDLTVLYEDRWAALEVKRSFNEPYQPNQEYYIDLLNRMSFAAMICPENKEEVLHALQVSFGTRRVSRVPFRQ